MSIRKNWRSVTGFFSRSQEKPSEVSHPPACHPSTRPAIASSSKVLLPDDIYQSKGRENNDPVDVAHIDSDFKSIVVPAAAPLLLHDGAGANEDQELSVNINETSGSTSNRNDTWEEAFQSLPLEEQHQLKTWINLAEQQRDSDLTTKPLNFSHEGAQILIAIAENKQEEYNKRLWRFELRGHVIEPRNLTKSIVSCLSTAGDIGVQFLPQPASIVWPLVKGLMQVPINADAELGAALMTAETVIRHISCGSFYEEIYLEKAEGELHKSLRSALVKLYAACLKLLNYASKQINANTAERLFLALLNRQDTQDQVSDLKDSFSKLTEMTQICQSKTTVFIDRQQTEFLEKFRNFDSFVHQNFTELFERLNENELLKILDWISSTKEYDRHAEFKRYRAPNTCEWILETAIFKNWVKSKSPILLWLQGTMGTGKTVLTSKVIDHLLDKLKNQDRDRIVYYYCRRKDEYENPDNIIRSFLRQLTTPSHNSNQISRDIQELFMKRGKSASQLPIETCKEELCRSLKKYRQVTFVIDALDECMQREIQSLLDTLMALLNTEHPTRIFVSARPDGYIKNCFAHYPTIKTDGLGSGVQKDIESFIEQEAPKFLYWQSFSTDHHELIKRRLLVESKGMFQWVYLQTANLKTCQMPEDILDGINEMPTELPQAYEHIYRTISQRPSQKVFVDRALMWMMSSCAPLKNEILLAGICHSGDIGPPHKAIEKDHVLSLCCNLIIFDEIEELWRFSHASVAEYVESKGPWSLQKSHSYAGKVCLQYLILSYGEVIGDQDLDYLVEPREVKPSGALYYIPEDNFVFPTDDPFLNYCRHHWAFHIQRHDRISQASKESADPLLMKLLKAFLQSPGQAGLAYQRWYEHMKTDISGLIWSLEHSSCMFFHENADLEDISPSTLPILAVCRFGLDAIFAEWWRRGDITPSQTNESGESLLELATKANSSQICSTLVNSFAINGNYDRASAALSIVIERGDCVTLNLLMHKGPCLGLVQLDYDKGLVSSARGGNIEVAKILIENGASVDLPLPTGDDGSALAAAASVGNLKLSRILINKGASVDLTLQTGRFGSALAAAAGYGNFEVAQFLIENGASVDLSFQTGRFESALAAAICLIENGPSVDMPLRSIDYAYTPSAAVDHGRFQVAQLLMERGASVDVNLQTGNYGSVLTAAAGIGSLKLTKILMERGAPVNLPLQTGNFGSALTAAIGCSNLDIARFLIDNGAFVDLPLPIGRFGSALALAAGRDNVKMTKLLIEKGASVNLPLQFGRFGSALAAALGCGNSSMAELLIENGAYVDLPLKTGDYGSALAAAIGCGSLELTQLLIESGAFVDLPLKIGHFGSALALAAGRGNIEITELLIENGAFVNLSIQTGHFGSALAAAVCHNKFKVAQLLIERGASVDLPLQIGGYTSALAAAADCSTPELNRLLIERCGST